MNAGSNFNVKTEKPENAITELITIVIIQDLIITLDQAA